MRSIPQALRCAPSASAGRWARRYFLSSSSASSTSTPISTPRALSLCPRHARPSHSSASTRAPARTEALSAAVSPAFIDDFDPALFDHAYASLRAPPAKSIPAVSASQPQKVEDWMPVRDSDFSPEHDAEPLTSEYEPPDPPNRPLPPSPPLASFDSTLKKSRRRRRTASEMAELEASTPPISLGTVPSADETRFDWRQRALSAVPHAKGRHWFPEAWRTRVPPPMTKVSEVQPLWAEIRRYAEQYVFMGRIGRKERKGRWKDTDSSFVPLLQAEQQESERQFAVRLREWPDEQLKREGYMLNNMSASTGWQPKFKVEGTVISFYPTGRDATRPLPPHQFEYVQLTSLGNSS